MEPLSPSDWELLEIHASSLEGGDLLDQISVIYPSQIVPIRVGSDVAHVQVLPWRTDASDQKELQGEESSRDSSYWSDSDGGFDDDTNEPEELHETANWPCLRLVADTEVVIVPKPRDDKVSSSSSEECRPPSWPMHVCLAKDDLATLATEWAVATGVETVPSPPPFSVTGSADTLSRLVPGWDDATVGAISPSSALAMVWRWDHPLSISGGAGAQGLRSVVRLFTSKDVPFGYVAMSTHLRYQLTLTPYFDKVQIQLLTWDQTQINDACIRDLVAHGALAVVLEPIHVAAAAWNAEPPDQVKPWRFPDGCDRFLPPIMGNGVPLTGHAEGKIDSMGRVRSILSSWVDVPTCLTPGNEDPLPLISGSLIALPWRDADSGDGGSGGGGKSLGRGSRTTYAITFRILDIPDGSTATKHERTVPLFIMADDLPSFLLRSVSMTQPASGNTAHNPKAGKKKIELESHNKIQALHPPRLEHFLNLLPPTAEYLPGMTDELLHCSRRMHSELIAREANCLDASRRDQSSQVEGIIITGEHGSGKTHMALLSAAFFRHADRRPVVYLDCRKLQTSSHVRMNTILNNITCAFHEATLFAPSLLVLDDLDVLVPNVNRTGKNDDGSVHHQQLINPALLNQVKVISDHIRSLLENLRHNCNSSKGIIVLATCFDRSSLAKSLLTAGVFNRFQPVPRFDGEQRKQLFDAMLRRQTPQMSGQAAAESRVDRCMLDGVIMPSFGKKTEGYRPRDLQNLAVRVGHALYIGSLGRSLPTSVAAESPPTKPSVLADALPLPPLIAEIVNKVCSTFIPLAHRSIHLTSPPAATWSAVGGLFRAKSILTEIVLNPVKYQPIYAKSPVSLPRGVLLHGYPGCGKSFIVPALASECSFNLVTCRGPELLDKFIGASEAKVRQLFERAYAAAPSILFLDEFDALAPRRGTDHTGVTDRVVNQLLTFLDGAESKMGGMVYIIAATSRPDKIDPALLRPGRLEKHVFVGYPQTVSEWNDLFRKIANSRILDENAQHFVSTGNIWNTIKKELSMDHLENLSAADLKGVMDTARLEAVHERLRMEKNFCARDDDMCKLTGSVSIGVQHLMNALKSTRPSLSSEDRRMLEQVYVPFLQDNKKCQKKNLQDLDAMDVFAVDDLEPRGCPSGITWPTRQRTALR